MYGKKHAISLTASEFNFTDNFNQLNFEDRKCYNEREKSKHNVQGKSFKKYSVTNCMMAKLIEIGEQTCKCLSWDIAAYFNKTDTKVRRLSLSSANLKSQLNQMTMT